MGAKMTLAIKDGKYVHVSEFGPGIGLDCGCYCPECSERVGSRIFSSESFRESCYFHEDDKSSCTGGQKESELHLLAKKIFKKNHWLITPAYEMTGELQFDYTKVTLEKKLGNIRPDVILTNEAGAQLLVEIAVTSFIKGNKKKIEEIERLELPTLEVNLQELYLQCPESSETLEKELQDLLIYRTNVKNWIWNKSENISESYRKQKVQEIRGESDNLWLWIIGVLGVSSIFYSLFGKKRRRYPKRK